MGPNQHTEVAAAVMEVFFYSESCRMHMRTEDEGWAEKGKASFKKQGFEFESMVVGR